MNVLRLAAFSKNGQGGNPAGVAFYDSMPAPEEMMSIAKEVGYSETAFLVKQEDGWRVRYFAPELEVPFCGHATIALGAALGERFGEGTYKLILNDSNITVRASKTDLGMAAALQSPETWSKDPDDAGCGDHLCGAAVFRGDSRCCRADLHDPACPSARHGRDQCGLECLSDFHARRGSAVVPDRDGPDVRSDLVELHPDL